MRKVLLDIQLTKEAQIVVGVPDDFEVDDL